MRVLVRETGSILVRAGKNDVLDVLQRVVKDGSLVSPDRVEGAGSTYVVRASADGTRVFHMRSGPAPVPTAQREREALRRSVESDLFQLQRVLDAQARDPPAQ